MQRLTLKEVPYSKIGEEILAWAVPVVICNRMMGRDRHQIAEHLLFTTTLDQHLTRRQFNVFYGHMVNANVKRVLQMTYSLASQVQQATALILLEDLEYGLGQAAFSDRQMAVGALGVAGRFIASEKHNVSELNAWKQFFSVEIAKQGEWDNHNLAEFNISKYL